MEKIARPKAMDAGSAMSLSRAMFVLIVRYAQLLRIRWVYLSVNPAAAAIDLYWNVMTCVHVPWCPVALQYIKDGDHVCFNCPKCYYEAKKKKKLVQVLIEDCKCSAACTEVDVDKMEHYEEV